MPLVGSGSGLRYIVGDPKGSRGAAEVWTYGKRRRMPQGGKDGCAAMGLYGNVRNSRLISNLRSQGSRRGAPTLTSEPCKWRTVLLLNRERPLGSSKRGAKNGLVHESCHKRLTNGPRWTWTTHEHVFGLGQDYAVEDMRVGW